MASELGSSSTKRDTAPLDVVARVRGEQRKHAIADSQQPTGCGVNCAGSPASADARSMRPVIIGSDGSTIKMSPP